MHMQVCDLYDLNLSLLHEQWNASQHHKTNQLLNVVIFTIWQWKIYMEGSKNEDGISEVETWNFTGRGCFRNGRLGSSVSLSGGGAGQILHQPITKPYLYNGSATAQET